jgi:integrase
MRGIKPERERGGRNRICSRKEYDELREAAAPEKRALIIIIIIGFWTGMRFGEIVDLTRDRLDLKGRTLRLCAADTKEK